MTALTPVRVADCGCPDTPHDGHHVLVRPTISLEGGIAAEEAMLEVAVREFASDGERTRALTYAWAPIFVRHGAADWDLCDENGDPRPFDIDELLGDYSMARLVADKCGELGYGSAVMAPFQTQPAKPSPTGPTRATTSRTRRPTRE